MSEWDDGNNVMVHYESIEANTDKAVLVDGEWVPKSQIAHIDYENKQIWMSLWIAEKKGFEYK